MADMSRFMSRFVLFSKCKKKKTVVQIQRCLGVGPILAGGAEPGQADRARSSPRPAQTVIFSNHGPKPDPVCEIPVSRAVDSARPARIINASYQKLPFGSGDYPREPGLASDIL